MNRKKLTEKIKNNGKPMLIAGFFAGIAVVTGVIVKGIRDMKASAKAQHEVDKAEFEAAKAEVKANFAEAKQKSKVTTYQDIVQEERVARIEEAIKRKKEAEARIVAAKGNK